MGSAREAAVMGATEELVATGEREWPPEDEVDRAGRPEPVVDRRVAEARVAEAPPEREASRAAAEVGQEVCPRRAAPAGPAAWEEREPVAPESGEPAARAD